jgi:hypothetical protein
MIQLAWFPIIFVVVLIVLAVLRLDGNSSEPPFKSFRESMRWPPKKGRRS